MTTATRHNPDGTRSHFAAIAQGGLRWDRLPMRLFASGNERFWNPDDVDFSRTRRTGSS